MAAVPVIGRSAESERVERFLSALAAGSRCLVVEGEVGIGKTTLLQWARGEAARRGHLVLSASPVEAEVPWEFSALADLLEAMPAPSLRDLPEPQRQAVEVAVFRELPADAPIDPRTLATAVLRVLRRAATEAPVLLAVDDLPWLDLPTARLLSYVLRRAGDAPIGLIGAVRLHWSARPAPLVTDTVDPDRVERLTVGPISFREMSALLAKRRVPVSSRAALRRIYELSGGNPLFAMELAAGAEGASVPQSLQRLLRSRISPLDGGARDVLLLAAMAAEPTEPVVVGAAADPGSAGAALVELVDLGILVRRGKDLSFAHPLVRSVVAGDATTAEWCDAHRRLAAVVRHPEARARHLALSAEGPDEAIALEVEAASVTAAARGAGETAALLAGLAVSLTPGGHPDDRNRRIVLEAEARFEASDPARACELIEQLVAGMDAGPARAELLLRLARYSLYGGRRLGQTKKLLAAMDEAGGDVGLRAAIAFELAGRASSGGYLDRAADYSAQALGLAEQTGDGALVARICAGWAMDAFRRGEGVRRDLVQQALDGPEQPLRLSMDQRPVATVAHLLHLADDLDGARRLYEIEYERASEEGIETGLPILLWGMVETEIWAGNWDRAEELCIEGSELAEESESPNALALMAGVRGQLHACRGRIDEARRDGQWCLDTATRLWFPGAMARGAQALGLAGIAAEDPADVHQRLGPICEFAASSGIGEPGLLRFMPDEIEALVRLGDLNRADQLLTPFERAATERGRVWALAASGRCRSLWLAAGGDLRAAEAALDRAVAHHAALGMPFELGRTLTVAAEIHRRARHRRQAQEALETAAAVFAKLGAPLWEQRARTELGRLGRRGGSGSGSELTEVERRVADLVVAGLTNAEVASQLFMSKRTVEAHLQHIYRKLGLRSRTQLSRVHPAPPS